jgi:hypothetical protein
LPSLVPPAAHALLSDLLREMWDDEQSLPWYIVLERLERVLEVVEGGVGGGSAGKDEGEDRVGREVNHGGDGSASGGGGGGGVKETLDDHHYEDEEMMDIDGVRQS